MTVSELMKELNKYPSAFKVRVVRDERMDEIEDVMPAENYGDGHYVVIVL